MININNKPWEKLRLLDVEKLLSSSVDENFFYEFKSDDEEPLRKFNLNTAVMLSKIYSEYTYWKDRDGLQNGGWFYSTIENIYYNTGLSKHQQLTACKELENYGITPVCLR